MTKYYGPTLVQVNQKTAKSFINRGYLEYVGHNPEGLIAQLNCPEVFFADQSHVFVEPALKTILDDFLPEERNLVLSQNRGKTILVRKTDELERMAKIFGLTLIESRNNSNNVYLFYEDSLFIDKYINQFKDEGSILQGNYFPALFENHQQRIYCSLLDSSCSFRLINFFAGAKLLADREIEFRISFKNRCFVLDQDNFNIAKKTKFGLSQANLIKQDKLGQLLSQRIDAKKKSKPYESMLELD